MTNSNWNSDETYTITTDSVDESGFVYSIDSSTISDITTATIDTSLISLDGDITLTIDEDSTFTIGYKDFQDKMPDITKVHNMCGYYPALQKAYENFKSIYQMVEQDYIGNYQEEDELPF